MLAYFELFPDKKKTELRSLFILRKNAASFELPPGEYCFLEYFCGDWDCDCNQTCINVLYRAGDQEAIQDVATISYCWASRSSSGTASVDKTFLDPLHPQAAFAPNILKFWTQMLKTDQAYAERLKKHSRQLRTYCRENNLTTDRELYDDVNESSQGVAAAFLSPKHNVTLEKPTDKIRRYRALKKAKKTQQRRQPR